jgi:hypothetical protein
MNLLTLLFRLPVMPLRVFAQTAKMLHDRAERKLRDRASARRHPEHAEQARVADIDDDLAQVEGQEVGRLLPGPANGARNRGAGTVCNEALI